MTGLDLRGLRKRFAGRTDKAAGLPGPWRDAGNEPHWIGPWLDRDVHHVMVDLDLEIDLPWAETRNYEYSKLYLATDPERGFSEDRVICFRLERRLGRHSVRLALPDDVLRSTRVQLRVDPFPFCSTGSYRVLAASLVSTSEMQLDMDATRRAERHELKRRVRQQVEESERTGAAICDHLPESISLELTARCNLTCGHCGVHGTPELHKLHNSYADLDSNVLKRLADELFPSLTAVTVIGRGEPLLAADATWQALIDALTQHGVLLRFVTNGTLLRRRLTAEVVPLLETVTVSMDGNSDETVRANRGGARLDQILNGVRHYHELRRAAGLARRPRLCLSWTLKRNNIHEVPDFIERMAEFEPDLFYARHLIVNFEKDQSESLIGEPELVNRYLRPAYAALQRMGIRADCPPLMDASPRPVELSPTRSGAVSSPVLLRPRLGRCPYIRRATVIYSNGDVATCTVPAARTAGSLTGPESFASIWNGAVLTGVRGAIDTPDEWAMCRSCYNREGRYSEQRAAAAKHEPYDLETPAPFSEQAWDYRDRRR